MNEISPARTTSLDTTSGRPATAAAVVLEAFSTMLPEGTALVRSAVAASKDRSADPVTRAEAAALTATAAPAPIAEPAAAALQGELHARLADRGLRRSELERLAVAAGVQHLGSIVAEAVVASPALAAMAPVEAAARRDEAERVLEHRSIAFDLLAIATHGRSTWLRRRTLLAATIVFASFFLRTVGALLASRSASVGARLGAAWFTLVLAASVVRPYVRYFARDFHPNEAAAAERSAFAPAMLESFA